MFMQAEDILQAMRSNNIEATMKSYKQMILAYTKSDDVLHLLTQKRTNNNSMYNLPFLTRMYDDFLKFCFRKILSIIIIILLKL